jgi:hypothetical protein
MCSGPTSRIARPLRCIHAPVDQFDERAHLRGFLHLGDRHPLGGDSACVTTMC